MRCVMDFFFGGLDVKLKLKLKLEIAFENMSNGGVKDLRIVSECVIYGGMNAGLEDMK